MRKISAMTMDLMMGQRGISQGTQIANTKAIKNMIKLNVPKDKILECYSEAEYNLAVDNIND